MNADDLTRIQRRAQTWGRYFSRHVADIADLDPENAGLDANDILLALDSLLDLVDRTRQSIQKEIVKLEVL